MTDDRVIDLEAAPYVLAHRSRCEGCGLNLRKFTTVYRFGGGYVYPRCQAKAVARARVVDTQTGEIIEA